MMGDTGKLQNMEIITVLLERQDYIHNTGKPGNGQGQKKVMS
jgi:hypothetical protein